MAVVGSDHRGRRVCVSCSAVQFLLSVIKIHLYVDCLHSSHCEAVSVPCSSEG